MTPAQAAWLRKLRDEGPQPKAPHGGAASAGQRLGYMAWESGIGWVIKPAGLAALSAYEASE